MIDWTSPAEIAKDACEDSFCLSIVPAIAHSVQWCSIDLCMRYWEYMCRFRIITYKFGMSKSYIAGSGLSLSTSIGNSLRGKNHSAGLWYVLFFPNQWICFDSSVDILLLRQILPTVCVDRHVRVHFSLNCLIPYLCTRIQCRVAEPNIVSPRC